MHTDEKFHRSQYRSRLNSNHMLRAVSKTVVAKGLKIRTQILKEVPQFALQFDTETRLAVLISRNRR